MSLPVLRNYRSAIPFALVAVGCLIAAARLHVLSKEAVGSIGFLFAGAAVTRWIDIAAERKRDAAEANARRHNDLDETRRLLYMALIVGTTGESRGAELIGTIVNALAHHQSQVSSDEATKHIAAVVRGNAGNKSEQWIRDQIKRITTELDP